MLNRPKILIIDDEINASKSLSNILEKKDYETSIVHTGKDAIAITQKNFFNIVLMDLKLPDILGTELIRPIKEKHPEIKRAIIPKGFFAKPFEFFRKLFMFSISFN